MRTILAAGLIAAFVAPAAQAAELNLNQTASPLQAGTALNTNLLSPLPAQQWRGDRGEDRRANRGDRHERRADRRDDRHERRADRREDRRDHRQVRNDRHDRYDRHDTNRRWDNNWRRDRRYDWSNHRRQHRNVYHIGRYSAPHRHHRYQRLRVGLRLGAPFYSSRYWVSNPARYRLPPAYGNYRWVRYYDDVMLVDVRRGHVVDVIYNFFW